MMSLLKYVDEPVHIETRESIINFSVGVKVVFNDRPGQVVRMSGPMMRIEFDNRLFDTVHYSRLRITEYPYSKVKNEYKEWIGNDIEYLKANLHISNHVLGKHFGRSASAISVQKTKIRKELKK